ncbi:hypothetical protein ES705_49270 [subsurface metagenome]
MNATIFIPIFLTLSASLSKEGNRASVIARPTPLKLNLIVVNLSSNAFIAAAVLVSITIPSSSASLPSSSIPSLPNFSNGTRSAPLRPKSVVAIAKASVLFSAVL